MKNTVILFAIVLFTFVSKSAFAQRNFTATDYKSLGSPAELIISDDFSSVEQGALSGNEDLVSVKFPSTMNKIAVRAFANCPNLEEVFIPNSVAAVGDSTFYGCEKLANVTLKPGVRIIGKDAFSGCEALTSIKIPSTIVKIGSGAFRGTGLASVNIPDSVKELGENAFAECSSLFDIFIGPCNTLKDQYMSEYGSFVRVQ